MSVQRVLIAGQWRDAAATGTFQAENPATKSPLPEQYPISTWSDCDAALDAAVRAAAELRELPPTTLADFLDRYAQGIEAKADALIAMANSETALPVKP